MGYISGDMLIMAAVEVSIDIMGAIFTFLAVVFITFIAIIIARGIRINKLSLESLKLEEDLKHWREQYDADIGKNIKEILTDVNELKILDLRKPKDKQVVHRISYSNDKTTVEWREFDPKELSLIVGTIDGYKLIVEFFKHNKWPKKDKKKVKVNKEK